MTAITSISENGSSEMDSIVSRLNYEGNDAEWDYERLVRIGAIAQDLGVEYLTTDFNCTVTDPAYVNEILDRLELEELETFRRILYV